MNMKIKGVVFDYGGVMTTSTMPLRVIDLAKDMGIPWDAIRRGFDAHRLDYDRDDISLREMYDAIWSDAGLKVDDATTALFMDADSRSWLYRRERTREWMAQLKARGFRIGILTNMCSRFGNEHFKKAFADFIELSDAMVISGEERVTKPDPKIYEILRERIALPANGLCFIDDVEKNCAAARACGWHAIRFVSSEQVEADFERLVAQ